MKVVFTKSRKKFPIFSWFIRWYQGTEYSHVALEVGEFYYQASEGKVNKEHYSYFLKEHTIVLSFEIADVDLSILEKELGRNYGTVQNVGIVLVDLWRAITHKLVNNPLSQDVNCSEFIFEKVLKQLYTDLDAYDKDYVKPKHIEKILRIRDFKKRNAGIHKI